MINILFCGNEYVFDGILTCALSIFKRSKYQGPFNFYVYTMDVSHLNPKYTPISDRLINYLDEVVKAYHPENKVIKVDVTDIYNKEFNYVVNFGIIMMNEGKPEFGFIKIPFKNEENANELKDAFEKAILFLEGK